MKTQIADPYPVHLNTSIDAIHAAESGQ